MDTILDLFILLGMALLMFVVYYLMDIVEFAIAQLFRYLRFKFYRRLQGK